MLPHLNCAMVFASTYQRFRGAMHIVQLEAAPPLIPHPRAGQGEAWTEEEQNDNDILLLEHCWRGSLHKALCKVCTAGSGASEELEDLSVPKRALWQMFHGRKPMPVFRAMDLLAALVSNLVFPPHKLSIPASPWHTLRRTLTLFIFGLSGSASRPGQIRPQSLDSSI
jgi:hypothetical protein